VGTVSGIGANVCGVDAGGMASGAANIAGAGGGGGVGG